MEGEDLARKMQEEEDARIAQELAGNLEGTGEAPAEEKPQG